ncbi:serine/threonine-protein kinase [Paractinoplanes lichenicola]|uniref:Serine/threonine protein kinase n=1 Tax=Paractinoplanes lichenicola TaxID=2802976 RepID=A0ABS1VE31_9ACTN|nr:serine/threonine-protein kinase [Actinoplanes lichenicola]MBL7252932.1 serine/threonine protein kinase [Actinoplanes lichenicola]
MPSRPLRPGDPRRLGDYHLLARLGEGGMGTVYLGRAPDGQPVAVKVIRPEFADDDEFRARFRSEVNRAREVPSFCTAAVLAADSDSDAPYLVVEYVDGPSLQEMIDERGPMAPGDLHSVAVGVAAALTAIHGAGVIHRDLKPANVLLSLGLPKVIDFGIARALGGSTHYTRPGDWMGTVGYMAPERLDSSLGPDSPAADIFAWGAVIAFAGTGRAPFGGDTPAAVVTQVLTQPPNLYGLPASLADLIAEALDKDPGKRPTSNELLQRLLLVQTPTLLTVDAPSPIAAEPVLPALQDRRSAGRFDARDLLEQIIAENPSQPPFVAAPMSPSADRRLGPARRDRSHSGPNRRHASGKPNRGRSRRIVLGAAILLLSAGTGVALASAQNPGNNSSTGATTTTDLHPDAASPVAERRGPSFSDPLTAPNRFHESAADGGSCTFRNSRLHVRVAGRSTYQCPGPTDEFSGDQTITVNLSLLGNDSCAMVWFRHHETRGYQLTACADTLELEERNGAVLTSLGRTSAVPLTPNAPHNLSITISAMHATVSVDNNPAVQASVADPGLASGQVQLGVFNNDPVKPAEVSFADMEVRSN